MIQSFDRAMQIIQLLTSDSKRSYWPISDISDRLGLPLSTTHRLIASLMKHELVSQTADTKHYTVGPRWMEIGLRQLEQVDLRTAARPIMERLAEEVKESVYLSIPSGLYAILIERIDSPSSLKVIDTLGVRIDMHIGAPNKTMLASMPPAEAEDILSVLIADPAERSKLLNRLPEIREAGFCVSYSERTEGTASVAAPIIGFGQKVAGSLSIGVPKGEIPQDRLDYLSKMVISTAREISARMGGLQTAIY
ncbi:IclR family transcriptional regulator [Paenibacillus terreus]|uniref:IclR family transcriptional regulator n=1 Tax=Paenibacillus terreus TaxID=1387834 RepID=A0ABV5BH59_9BACL